MDVRRQGIYGWFADRAWAGDAALAGVLLVVAVVDIRYLDGLEALTSVLLVGPMFIRRTRPEAALVISLVLELLLLAYGSGPHLTSVTVLFIVYSSVVYARDRVWGYLAFGAGILGAVAAPLRWYSYGLLQLAVAVTLLLALVTIAYIAGDRARSEQEHRATETAALAERNRLLTAERDQRVQYAAAAERTRIARELHDIVAHSLAVIVVQADGGAAAAAKNPAVAEPVLRTIAETSRQALAEMRALVGVLRAEPARSDDLTEYLPQPGLGSLDRLIEQTRQAGIGVVLTLPDPAPQLEPSIDLTVYRIVQEGLTNVLKHAGPAATAQIEIAVQDGQVAIDVIDDGRGAAAISDGAGNGIRGMRERVGVLHGALWAGPRPGGGFRLHAVVPTRLPQAGP